MADHESISKNTEESEKSSEEPFLVPVDYPVKVDLSQEERPEEHLELRSREESAVGERGYQTSYTVTEADFGQGQPEGPGAQRIDPLELEQGRENTSGMENKGCITCLAIILGIAALLILILVPLGFSDLDYYEIGFVKSKTTGKVDTSEVYLGGRHFVGVDKTFKKFKADAHVETFYRVIVFNKEKLQVAMTCALEYFLYPKELPILHNAYDIRYRPVLQKTVLAAMKAEAAKFTVNEYRLQREAVAMALKNAAKVALGGTCNRTNATQERNCTRPERGLNAELRYFQLELVSITKEQEERFLKQVIETEKQDTVQFKQQELLMRKETARLKRIIENEASEISQNATANAELISARAGATAKALVEDARNSGLEIMFSALNITKAEHKKSFDYLRTLRDSKQANIYVGFNSLIGKP